MILPDVNVLLYATNETAVHHEVCRRWLQASLANERPVGFAWIVLVAFLRLSTKHGVFPTPLAVGDATALVEDWLSRRPSQIVQPTHRHLAALHGLLAETGTGGNLVSDAHLAALALEHGGTVYSFDRDFGRFPGVRWELPSA